jgi:hypothetical protein
MFALSGQDSLIEVGLRAFKTRYWDKAWERHANLSECKGVFERPGHFVNVVQVQPLREAFTYVVSLEGNSVLPDGPLFVFVDLRQAIENNQDYGVLEFQEEAMVPAGRMYNWMEAWPRRAWPPEVHGRRLVQYDGKLDVRVLIRRCVRRSLNRSAIRYLPTVLLDLVSQYV